MRYMALPVSFRWDEGFVKRIDEARGLVPRSAFVRSAVEQALREPSAMGPVAEIAAPAERSRVEQALSEAKEPFDRTQADLGSVSSSEGVRSAAPAQPRVRSSSVARPFRPAPKARA